MDWKRNKFALITLLCFLLCTIGLNAQSTAGDSVATQGDQPPTWSKEQIENARKEVVFIRKDEATSQDDSRPELDIDENVLQSRNEWWLSPAFQFAMILIVAALLFFMVSKLLLGRRRGDEKMASDLVYTVKAIEDDLLNADPQRVLQQLLDAGHFTLATRMLFLALLKDMHDLKVISWKKDKTNRHFLNDMFSHPAYSAFRDLVDAYELVWYGERTLRQEQFSQLKNMFDAFRKQLNP